MEDLLLIVDRITGELAVCEIEGRSMVEIPLADLPQGLREGDCLRPVPEGYALDAEETRRRREHSRDMLRSLLERSGEGQG